MPVVSETLAQPIETPEISLCQEIADLKTIIFCLHLAKLFLCIYSISVCTIIANKKTTLTLG